jgi:hypothetical protein
VKPGRAQAGTYGHPSQYAPAGVKAA